MSSLLILSLFFIPGGHMVMIHSKPQHSYNSETIAHYW